MNRFGIPVQYLLIAMILAALAACGGGGSSSSSNDGGNGGNGGNEGGSEVTFTAVVLQPLSGSAFSVGAAINKSNEAVGISDGGSTAPTTMKAVAWAVTTTGTTTTSTVTQLAMPAGAGDYSAANANNDGGAIVGEIEAAPGGAVVPAFWPSRTATLAQVVLLQQGTATQGAAYGINTAGRIVGELLTGGIPSAATWSGPAAAPVNLPEATGTIASSAHFINDNGEIVGQVTDAIGEHAALWRPDAAGAYASAPILLPGTTTMSGSSVALANNTAGTIVGEVTDNVGKVHAVKWTRDAAGTYTPVDLGSASISSGAAGINDRGLVVGNAVIDVGGASRANSWDADTDTDLTVDATLGNSQAYAINAANRVVGVKGVQAFIAVPK